MRNNMTIMRMYHHFLQAFVNLWRLAFARITGFRVLSLLDFNVILYRLREKLAGEKKKKFQTNSLLLFTIFMLVPNTLIGKNPTFGMKTQHLFPLLKAQRKSSDTYKISTAK